MPPALPPICGVVTASKQYPDTIKGPKYAYFVVDDENNTWIIIKSWYSVSEFVKGVRTQIYYKEYKVLGFVHGITLG